MQTAEGAEAVAITYVYQFDTAWWDIEIYGGLLGVECYLDVTTTTGLQQ